MADVGVRIEGAAQLRRTLKQAGGDLAQLKAANQAAALTVAEHAAILAPRRTGRLARTIRASGTNTAGVVRTGNNRKSVGGVPYAGPIHWGWPARNIPANEFVTEAAEATEPVWLGAYEAAMLDAINNVKGK